MLNSESVSVKTAHTSSSSSGMTSSVRRSSFSSTSTSTSSSVVTTGASVVAEIGKDLSQHISCHELSGSNGDPDILKKASAGAAEWRCAVSVNSHGGSSVSAQRLKQIMGWDDLPAWRKDNHFIRSGYRHESFSFWGCVKSMTYMHNESVNIYSHLVGSLFFLIFLGITLDVLLPRYPSTSAKDFAVFVFFFVGAVLCLGMSSTYHCMNCHSESVAKFGNRLDYIGIIFLIVGSFVPAIYYGLHSLSRSMPVFFAIVAVFGTICTVLTLRKEFADPSWRTFRASMFVVFGVSGVIPMAYCGFKLGYDELNSRVQLPYMLLEGALYITGAAIYAARIPERFKPGKFDLIGSSHQIFHMFVLAAAVSHLIGIIKAYKFCHGERNGF
ncbi:hemolysin-III related-domain-containing protein [Kockiozyma suomiensis]|uniref:hemolysin-III related-domain-containing protein n=1 Tax=Kockiozyma suomiensis TaxID=1337062 RepID=UPI00334437A9